MAILRNPCFTPGVFNDMIRSRSANEPGRETGDQGRGDGLSASSTLKERMKKR